MDTGRYMKSSHTRNCKPRAANNVRLREELSRCTSLGIGTPLLRLQDLREASGYLQASEEQPLCMDIDKADITSSIRESKIIPLAYQCIPEVHIQNSARDTDSCWESKCGDFSDEEIVAVTFMFSFSPAIRPCAVQLSSKSLLYVEPSHLWRVTFEAPCTLHIGDNESSIGFRQHFVAPIYDQALSHNEDSNQRAISFVSSRKRGTLSRKRLLFEGDSAASVQTERRGCRILHVWAKRLCVSPCHIMALVRLPCMMSADNLGSSCGGQHETNSCIWIRIHSLPREQVGSQRIGEDSRLDAPDVPNVSLSACLVPIALSFGISFLRHPSVQVGNSIEPSQRFASGQALHFLQPELDTFNLGRKYLT